MEKNIFLLSFLFVLHFFGRLNAQSNNTSIATQFNEYRRSVLQEKMFVHTDKDLYLAGEQIWFKLYDIDGSFHLPLLLNKVAYVELLNVNQRPVLQLKIALDKGKGNGNIALPDNLPSGNYLLRAYSNWMKNFDAEFFFEKKLTVINTLNEAAAIPKVDSAAIFNFQLFPEGGNLVYGIESKVAFKAVDRYGKGVKDFKGYILADQNDTIVSFNPLLFGMGQFFLKPERGRTYQAVIYIPGRQPIHQPIPLAADNGYVLKMNEGDKGRLKLTVLCSPLYNEQKIQVFGHTRNSVTYVQTGILNNGSARFEIDQSALGEGITHFTVFDAQSQPLCERLFFKKPERIISIEGSVAQQTVLPRKNLVINVDVKNEQGVADNADLSVSIFRIDSLMEPDEANILNYLLLQSDLKGTIESPSYYFANEGKEIKEGLDNLMLTHGWSRFKWNQVIEKNRQAIRYLPEIEGHVVSARIYHATTNSPAAEVVSYLSMPGKYFQLHNGKTDKEGRAFFFTKNFYDTTEMVVQSEGAEDRDLRIDVETPFAETYSSRTYATPNLSALPLDLLRLKSVNMQVQNAYATEASFVNIKQDTISFYGRPEAKYSLDDYVRFPTMEEVLREYVREINVHRQRGNYRLDMIRVYPNGLAEKRNPLVLLDGVPVLDNVNKIIAYDPLKIKELEIINKDYFLGNSIFQGIANFKSYTGKPEGFNIDPKATVIDYEGLQRQKEFYTPEYAMSNQVNSRLPDFRSLLLWQPNVMVKNGKAELNFYTSDLPGRYIVVIQGISKDGRPGYKTLYFNVMDPGFVQSK